MQTNAKTARPGAERKRPDRRPKKQAQPKKAGPQTAQQTIPYREIFKDGICRVNDKLYTKSMEYEDINYQLAQADDQSAIFDGYCAFLNSFDSSLPFQLSFINHRSRPESKYKLNIPTQDDEYSEMRSEYVEMLEGQIAKSNNGIVRTKLLTFGVFSAWIENETENIQKLVDAGEWTEAEATEALEYYDEILKSILEGKMVGKRASSSDDQLFFSMPDNAQPEQYQTFVFDGNTYKSIGPFDTEEELFNALKEYTDTEVEAGTMSQAEATALLEKYQ